MASGFDDAFGSDDAFVQVRVQGAAEGVYRELLKAILTGRLKPGHLLPQDQLAKQMGVSRTPLREALMRLASVGLVELERNRGARVTDLAFGDMEHAWRGRMVIEPGAAKLAATGGDPESLSAMRRAIRRQRAAVESVEETLLANRDFHLALVAASQNPYLIRFSEMLWAFQIAVPIFGPQAQGREQRLLWPDEHQGILDAICAGEGDVASARTLAHIAAYPPHPRSAT